MKGILWYYTRLSGAAEPIFETSKWVAGLTKFQVPRLEIIQTGHARAIDHYILKYLTKVEDPEVSLNIVATFYSTTSTNNNAGERQCEQTLGPASLHVSTVKKCESFF